MGVKKGSDVAVVVIERGRQWGRRRGGGSCAVTWRSRVVSCRRARPWGGPNAGIDRGAQRRPWRPCVVVVVVDDGGGSESRNGMVTMCDASDVSTVVARFGNSRALISN